MGAAIGKMQVGCREKHTLRGEKTSREKERGVCIAKEKKVSFASLLELLLSGEVSQERGCGRQIPPSKNCLKKGAKASSVHSNSSKQRIIYDLGRMRMKI